MSEADYEELIDFYWKNARSHIDDSICLTLEDVEKLKNELILKIEKCKKESLQIEHID
jgi:hypothetical protein